MPYIIEIAPYISFSYKKNTIIFATWNCFFWCDSHVHKQRVIKQPIYMSHSTSRCNFLHPTELCNIILFIDC